MTTKVAAVQLRSTPDKEANLAKALGLVREAARAGAKLVATPENTDAIAPREQRLAMAESLDGPFIAAWSALAAELETWILIGSFGERIEGDARVHNTSVLIDAAGRLGAIYRKIHLFDADPPDGVPYRESANVKPGTEVVAVDTPIGRLGLTICYDLRFPELHRALSARGATAIAVPSAFTVPTGEAHWETLLRARAIENLSYVIAPAQVGTHFPGRASYGHALIVDPWGRVVADAGGANEGFVLADVNPLEISKIRDMLPALTHRRM